MLTTVTTTRKIFTTLYSVFRNPANRLSTMQWGGCVMVFVGLLCEETPTLTPTLPLIPTLARALAPTPYPSLSPSPEPRAPNLESLPP